MTEENEVFTPKAETVKSPFIVMQDFISVKQCEDIISKIGNIETKHDHEGRPIKTEYRNEDAVVQHLYPAITNLIGKLEDYYQGFESNGKVDYLLQDYPEGTVGHAEDPFCVNSKHLRRKWVKVSDVELTAVLWLKDHNDEPPLDVRSEVYGGKLEFPAYDFSLMPQRGTLIIFPAGPHFIQAVSPVMVGNCTQIRINLKADKPFLYQPSKYRGTWLQWFEAYY